MGAAWMSGVGLAVKRCGCGPLTCSSNMWRPRRSPGGCGCRPSRPTGGSRPGGGTAATGYGPRAPAATGVASMMAGLIAARPGLRTRLFYRIRVYHGRKREAKGLGEADYIRLLQDLEWLG